MPEPPISFARGAPAPELIPAAELAECAYAVAVREGARLFSYGPGAGYGPPGVRGGPLGTQRRVGGARFAVSVTPKQ